MSAPGEASSLAGRRERLRQRLLRVNTVVGIILLAVLALGLAACLAGVRAKRNQRRAETAEDLAQEQLWHALLSEARAARRSGRTGRRTSALTAISRAAALQPSAELRDEAIAALALTDLAPGLPLGQIDRQHQFCTFDAGLRAYIVGDCRGRFEVHRLPGYEKTLDLASAPALTNVPRLVLDCVLSKEGHFFAASFKDGALAVWETDKGRPLFVHAPPKPGIARMEFSLDETQLAFTDSAHDGALRVITLPEGRDYPLRVSAKPKAFSFRPGTNQVAVTDGQEIQILNFDTGTLIRSLASPDTLTDLRWAPDGMKLAAVTAGEDIYLWSFHPEEFWVLPGHSAKLRSMVFSPGSDRLMTASLEGETRIWDCTLGRELIRTPDGIGLAFNTDGQEIGYFIPGTGVGTWRVIPGHGFRTLMGQGGRSQDAIAFDLSPDGRWLTRQLGNGFELWDLRTAQPGQFIPVPDLRSVMLNPARDDVVLCRAGRIETHSLESLSSGNHGTELGPGRPIPLPPNVKARQAALSRDGNTLAVELSDLRVVVLDWNGARDPVFLHGRSSLFFYYGPASATGAGRLAISPEGRWVGIGYGVASGPRIWDARTGEVVTTLKAGEGAIAFSPDGQWVGATSADGCSLWRTGSWQCAWRNPQDRLNGRFTSFAFNGDGRSFVYMLDRYSLALCDTASHTILARLTAPELQSLDVVRFAADGTRLVASTSNNQVQAWDLSAIQQQLRPWRLAWPLAPGDKRPIVIPASAWSLTTLTPVLGLVAAGAAALSTLLILRRHRELVHEVFATEELIDCRDRELAVERELHRLKSNFVSIVSHEFRTPLGVIVSSAEILADYLPRLSEARRKEHLHDIVGAARRMSDLIGEVLLLGQVEAGRMQCCPKSLDVRAFCRKVIEDVSLATRRRCPVIFDGKASPSDAILDRRLLAIVLSNLLSNAVKYSPEGRPVHLAVAREGTEIVIEVRDQGIGIPAEDQPELFKTFRRARNVGEIPGSGLGLTIVKRCVELHQGSLTFVSTLNVGTTFTARLREGSSHGEPNTSTWNVRANKKTHSSDRAQLRCPTLIDQNQLAADVRKH